MTCQSIGQDSSLTFQICCYKNDKLGHWANECSKLESYLGKNLLIKDHANDVVDHIYNDSISNGKILCRDCGANLVIRKNLLTSKDD
jgi:hypothetical protein